MLRSQHFILLRKSKVSIELIALGAVLGLGAPGQSTLKSGLATSVTRTCIFQNAPCFMDFLRVEFEQVLVPHTAQLDPTHAKFARATSPGVAKS